MKQTGIDRRDFLSMSAGGLGWYLLAGCRSDGAKRIGRPNLLFVFADQWRAQSTGYAGNPDVRTPNLDRMETQSVNFVNAVSCCPVCSPYRASLITGRYPLTHGVFLNDLRLNDEAVSIAQVYRDAGYQTAYIGKWHLDGTGRTACIPPERRQGFDYWKVLECTHAYNKSEYYENNIPGKKVWDGYDALAQTEDAVAFLKDPARRQQPFALFLSWGPPHDPYRTGPRQLLDEYDAKILTLRPNVPPEQYEQARKNTAGYYAHITALDGCLGRLLAALGETGLQDNTMVVFTSDHGDMLHSRGLLKKQKPWDEAIRVPFLLRCPAAWGVESRRLTMPLNVPDIMPTLLGLSGLAIPPTVEGEDCSAVALGRRQDHDRAALILCAVPFGEWIRKNGGKEYRGVRTQRYTYVRDLEGPWLLYDNETDPWQQTNLIGNPAYAAVETRLAAQLQEMLDKTGDAFLSGPELVARCGYRVDGNETVGYQNEASHGQVSVSCRS